MHSTRLTRPATLLLALGLATLGLALGLLNRPAIPLEKLSIAVARTPLSTPIFVAADRGYFRQQGLDVELHEVIGGNRAFDQLIEGRTDLATSSDSVIMFNSFERRDFTVLASFVTSDNDIKLIASTDGPLRSVIDLAHHRIATTPGSSSEYFLHSIALMHDIDGSRLETRAINPENMSANLLDGHVEALSTWEPYAYQTVRALGEKAVVLPTRGLHSINFNLLALDSTVTTRRETLAAALRALDQSIDFMHLNPGQARKIARDRLGLEADFIEWVWPDYNFRLGLPNSLLIALDSGARWALNNGHVKAQPLPDFRHFLDGSLLQQVIPSTGQP
ncbi:ABC transporter substrate-binding protein [Marinobacterium nitratireducens]|uniref:ABC transporter substrate-binding protein n=1 Tax=Marinobacterium nitratireducens TaxID=518897 RepID=A0A918DWH6_9GAMM|nr:ABC transporter substrate-binding protein [Marinobacterium nitratireducens]GGO85687.1 ABC transporter substrate-binding protein [Marinobacterium nitratireducens]